LFSTNLSFIPVDLQWGPRGALYVCDWYNPIKGHMQYSLRDPRRDRDSGRIWRITAKDRPLIEPIDFAAASIEDLLELLKRPEYRIRDWAKRELRQRDRGQALVALDAWTESLDSSDPRYRHHQLAAVWTYRSLGLVDLPASVLGVDHVDATAAKDWPDSLRIGVRTLRELLSCDDHRARAAATKQLRYWHPLLDDATELLRRSANDANGIVRMQAVIAATYFGTEAALEAILDVFRYPTEGHLQYAITSALGSRTLKPFWQDNDRWQIALRLKRAAEDSAIKEPPPTAQQAEFDSRKDLKRVDISCIPERMLFSLTEFRARPGQPVKIVFTNPDATDHNLVVVEPGALAEVGTAANEMAKDPRNAKSNFIPREKSDLILHASPMIGPNRSSRVHVLRFEAPEQPGVYPYVCTFPGHWVVMNGVMVVADTEQQAEQMLAKTQPAIVNRWTLEDFSESDLMHGDVDPQAQSRGMMAFVKGGCNQCHVIAGHGVNLGPDLAESVKKMKGIELLRQMIEPSSTIHEDFQMHRFLLTDGRVVTGVIVKETRKHYDVATNLLTPNSLTRVPKQDVELQSASKVSPMPTGLLDVLTKQEVIDLHAYVQSGGYQMPEHLPKHHHDHGKAKPPAKSAK
jgi:putative heme-binding domain-containing protein